MGFPEEPLLLAQNGCLVRFDDQRGRIAGQVEVGRVFVDGKGLGQGISPPSQLSLNFFLIL